MTRVGAGAFTKKGAKLLRMVEAPSEDDDDDREDDDRENDDRDDAREDDDEDEDDGDDDRGSDFDEDEEDEEEEDADAEIARQPPTTGKRARVNRFVDDVAEEEDDDEDDDAGAGAGGKKKKKAKRGASAFIDDEAADDDDDEDDDDEGEEEEGFDDEEREAVRREMDTRLHARMENQERFERMENEEELERMIKERYAAPRYEAGRGQVDENVDQQALHPTVRDPKLWLVTVKIGKERETVVCLMQKTINLAKQGKPAMQILSAVSQDHLKGYIYVEAEREDYVRKALQGMRHVYHSKPIRLVPINEMVDSISVAKKEVSVVKQDSWVRMRTGVYKGDLAQVIDVNYADNQCTVKLLPRIDYQHLADKESGAAKGKSKSSIRPPPRMFSEAEAKRMNLSLEKGRFDRGMNDYVDILCGTTKIKDGYHMKTCSLATVKLADTPTLDELQKFAVSDDADGQGTQGKNALAALSKAVGERKTDLKFMAGDQVVVVEGDLKNLEGVVDRIHADGRVTINPSHKELHEPLTFKPGQLRKRFKTGSSVRVLHGKHEGVVGMVVKVDRDIAHIFSTVSNEEFQVFMHDLADSEETTQRIDTIGEYALHDLALLDGSEVGCIVRVEKDIAFVMTNAGTPDRPEIKPVKLHELKKKLLSRNISAQDAHMDTIDQGSMVRIIDGKYKDATGTVEHIYKGTLWIRARHVQEHGGIVCIRSRNCVAHGGNKSSQIGGGLAAQMMGASGLPPKSPGHALLASSYTSGLRGELMSQSHQAPRAPVRPMGGRGRQDALIGQTKKIRSGAYKGYVGRIVDVNDTSVRLELQAQARTVTVNREHLDVPQVAQSRDSYMAPRATSIYDAPGARTPAHYPMTPAHGGGVTPMHGSMTPAREAAWNPTATPAHLPHDNWEPTSTAGTGWGNTSMGYTPGGYGDSASLAGPTPGGYGGPTPGGYGGPTPGGYGGSTPGGYGGPTPGGYGGPTPGGYGGPTPGGYGGPTPGGYDAPAPETEAPSVVTWPADYAGRFIPGVVVRLSSGAQGYVTSVGPGGASFKVKIGAVRHRDGVEVLESVPKNAEEETVTESELEIVAPENKSHIIVVAEKDSQVARGETGQLVSIDGVDGVIRVNSSGDVVILDMSCLARYWHEQ